MGCKEGLEKEEVLSKNKSSEFARASMFAENLKHSGLLTMRHVEEFAFSGTYTNLSEYCQPSQLTLQFFPSRSISPLVFIHTSMETYTRHKFSWRPLLLRRTRLYELLQ